VRCAIMMINQNQTVTDREVADSTCRRLAVVPDSHHRQFNRLIKYHIHSVHLSTPQSRPITAAAAADHDDDDDDDGFRLSYD